MHGRGHLDGEDADGAAAADRPAATAHRLPAGPRLAVAGTRVRILAVVQEAGHRVLAVRTSSMVDRRARCTAIGVGLQDAGEGLKMLHGVLVLSIARGV